MRKIFGLRYNLILLESSVSLIPAMDRSLFKMLHDVLSLSLSILVLLHSFHGRNYVLPIIVYVHNVLYINIGTRLGDVRDK